MTPEEIKDIIKNKNAEIAESFKGTLSVSKCLEYLTKPFDKEGVAKKCFDKGFDDPNSKYYQMSVEAILESWEAKAAESCHYGSLSDDYICCRLEKPEMLESWKLDHSYDYDKRLKQSCNGFDQFYETLTTATDYKYVDREVKMFIENDKGEKINGRLDCLFYSPSKDRLLVIDWKTSASVDKSNKWSKMLGPCYDKDECNGNEYTIQVQMYKKALAETYNILPSTQIDVFICQFIPVTSGSKSYIIHNQNFEYDSALLNSIIEFAYRKHNAKKQTQNN